MSDYEEDFDDYEGDFFYVEDEYMEADDLAEHAVASPPPTTCADAGSLEDWDRFDYFNDLEYASDGYDDTIFQAHDVKGAKAGSKRKRTVKYNHSRKRISTESVGVHVEHSFSGHSPIIWRSQRDRGVKPKMLDDNAQSYALFKDWREQLADTPDWAKGSATEPQNGHALQPSKTNAAFVTDPVSPPYGEMEEDDIDEEASDEEEGIPQEALLAALQRQIAAAGGPLSGMDPQQLLQYVMRMTADKDAGEDIAGEMAEAMLGGEDDDGDTDAEENLLSWVAQQRNANKEVVENVPKSPEAPHDSKPPPTPPSSEANRSIRVSGTSAMPSNTSTEPLAKTHSLKRKADDEASGEGATKVVKKRVTKSFNAPTAASQAKTTTTRTTRSKTGTRG